MNSPKAPSKPGFSRYFRYLAWPLAVVFGLLARLRLWLYRHGIFSVSRLSRPVISIGNLAMGGTGKSPLTMDLIEFFQDQGLRVAVLSRGYGRQEPKRSLQVTAQTSFRDGGDEPVMMARRYPRALIAVGPSRHTAANALAEKPDVYLLDDGFQHRQLHRDLDLVLLDVTQASPRLFPLGMFREGWWGLRRADAVILTRWEIDTNMKFWRERVHREKPGIPLLACRFKPLKLHHLNGEFADEVDVLKEMRIAAYAGIAKPHLFFESLKNLGADLVATKALADHGVFPINEAANWFQTVARLGVDAVITTEKDAVKLDNHEGFGIVVLFISTGVIWQDRSPLEQILKKLSPQKESE